MTMKKFITVFYTVIMTIGLTASVSFANGSGAGIATSPHDFSAEVWNHRAEICRVCHVPHDHGRNDAIGSEGLLWNHQLSSATYLMYAEDTHTNFIDGVADPEPTGVSKLCLGCHDGTVAIDEFDNKVGTPQTTFISAYNAGYQIPGIADVGSDKNLSNTHPISIVYDNVADPNLKPTTAPMGLSGTIADVLDGGKVQCSSCHDVHDQESVANTHLLRVAQTVSQGGSASGLCLTCHIK
ncbi:MAG: cytochrome C [Nitrospirae bacterium CG08_land_8_20_14_0_20_52_24]|nr:MAG: cytochrome C [Nitrospirae bacterium CG08_land_8_20_14_0_20_52_24]